jgi:predicted nucleotidyltransferase
MKDVAIKRYGDNIAIIAMYGSRARGDFDPDSDLEFFAIAENGIKVDIEFTFNGIPVDMSSQTWERIEEVSKIDTHWILPAGALAYCRVIYTRSIEDKARFDKIIEEIKQPQKYCKKSVLKASKIFLDMYGFLGKLQFSKYQNDLQEARDACWHLIISVTYIVGHANSRYLKHNWGANLDEIFSLDKVPEGLQQLIDDMISETDFDKILEVANRLVEVTRQFMITLTLGQEEDSELEMLRTSDSLAFLNKIKKAGRKKHLYAAGYAIHTFQSLVARDLLRLAKIWDQSTKFKLYSEYKELYEKQYVDFFDTMSSKDYEKMTQLADGIYTTLLEFNIGQVPDFQSLEEIKQNLL